MSSQTPKEIDRAAGRCFESSIPANWATRSQQDQEDYGIDWEVELTTTNDKATGFIFKVQQKGVENAERLVDNTVAFRGLPIEKMEYYLRKVRIPVVFVVVDLMTMTSYWVPLHGNREVENNLAEAKRYGHATMSVHLPSHNVLPATANELLEAVRNMMVVLTIEGLQTMPSANTYRVLAATPDLEDVDRRLRFTQAAVRAEKTQRLIEQGKQGTQAAFNQAIAINQKAFSDSDEPIESRFMAGTELIRIRSGLATRVGGSDQREEVIRIRLSIHDEQVRITRKLPSSHPLRYYSLFLARLARLMARVERLVGLSFSLLIQGDDTEEFTRYITAAAKWRAHAAVAYELHRAQRLFLEISARGSLEIRVDGWINLTNAIIVLFTQLRQDALEAAEQSLRGWLTDIGLACREEVVMSGHGNTIGAYAYNIAHLALGTDAFDSSLVEARTFVAGIAESKERITAERRLDALAAIAQAPSTPPTDDNESVEAVVLQMARGLGIRVDDPSDQTGQLVRIGLRDRNPERVVRQCEHIMVQIESYGLPAEMLGLHTAGSKSVRCTKHRYRKSGYSLDDTYRAFEAAHCQSCPDRRPRSPDWRWSLGWQGAQAANQTHEHNVAASQPLGVALSKVTTKKEKRKKKRKR